MFDDNLAYVMLRQPSDVEELPSRRIKTSVKSFEQQEKLTGRMLECKDNVGLKNTALMSHLLEDKLCDLKKDVFSIFGHYLLISKLAEN